MGLAAIFMQMLMKLLGYKFICEITIIGAEAWAKSTQNTYDDRVAEALSKALKD